MSYSMRSGLVDSLESLECLVAQSREITKKEFTKYYWEFNKCCHNMQEDVSKGDKNQLFWKGLPSELQHDIFNELRVGNPSISWHKAPAIEDVHQTALKVLDKNSIFFNLTVSRGKTKTKKSKHSLTKKKSKSDRIYKVQMIQTLIQEMMGNAIRLFATEIVVTVKTTAALLMTVILTQN